MNRWIVLCLMSLLANPLAAEIYKWTDSSGDVHFSDKPHPGSEKIQLPNVQTYTAPISEKIESPPPPPGTTDENPYTRLTIKSPEDQVTIRNAQGYVSVIAEVEPELKPEDKLQMIFDGQPMGTPQPTTVFALKEVDRGSHTIAVQLLGAAGQVMITSETITIFMQPPRINMGKNSP